MDYINFSAKTVDDAITEACQKFTVTSDKLDYIVEEEGSSGFLGIGAKPAVIKARVKSSVADKAKDFLRDVFEPSLWRKHRSTAISCRWTIWRKRRGIGCC